MSLALRDIHKRYGPVHANAGVTVEIAPGELHGLLGENGAGKSTLMKVLSGFIESDSGEIVLGGTTLNLASPKDAIDAGIGMLHQDPLVFHPFTVLDNFLIGAQGRLDRKGGAARLAEASARYGFSFDPSALAGTLTVGERQQLEIARLLSLGARVLIFDEPTTGISESQRTMLFAVLRTLAADGLMVIFVSHKLEEIAALCDRVTVMRGGGVVGRADLPIPADDLVRMMFGDITVGAERPTAPIGPAAVALNGVAVRDRHLDVTDLTISVGSGEVIGLAGLEGSGQREMLRACTGLLCPTAGTIRVGGSDLTGRSLEAFLRAGVHLLPAGRLEEGLIPGLTIAEHLELAGTNSDFVVDRAAAEFVAVDRIGEFSIKGEADTHADALSGGNQQRLLLAMMPEGLRLLLMEHPTRGLDIESAEWVWRRLLERRTDGTAIVFASADIDELLRYSDRIAVFFEGRILRVVDAAEATPEAIGNLIGGRNV
jgi:simple sugar transport system ATP-binding protein